MYVIVRCGNLLWFLTSLAACLLMLFALNSPNWLIGAPVSAQLPNSYTSSAFRPTSNPYQTIPDTTSITISPSVGVYTTCRIPPDQSKYSDYKNRCGAIGVEGLATDAEVFPTLWKVATVCIAVGIFIMFVSLVSGCFSFCIQSVFKKSIFTVSGLAQTVAGMFFILGTILQPMGWGSSRVLSLCGRNASPFDPDQCYIGRGLYLAIFGTAMTFAASALSTLAERVTSSDSVQDRIYEGQTLICIP